MTGTTSPRLPSLRSTSTASPSPIPCGVTRCGLPSISWKACVITGNCLTAWMMPKAMRCVNETFLPVGPSWASCALSALLRASSARAAMSRNDVAVGTVRWSVMFVTNRAAGPVMGVAPAGRWEMGEGLSAGMGGPSPFSLLPMTSARSLGIIGSSAVFPLSNSFRHSSPTEAGSRRYCSYITWTNAALWVPKTNSLTTCNLNRAPRLGEGYVAAHDAGPRDAAGSAPRARQRRWRLFPGPDDAGFGPRRRSHSVSRRQHDEGAGDDPAVSGPRRASPVPRRLDRRHERLRVDRGQLAVPARQGRRLGLDT